MNDRFIREPECLATTGLSRTTRWRLERRGLFPKRKKISENAVGWLESEILSWLRSKANGDEDDPEEDAEAIIDYVRRAHLDYTPFSFWDDKDVHIQALVEKIDLKSLFAPIFGKFHIPFANARGWSDLHSRASMMRRFKDMEAAGKQCVLLYCGDHDPGGLNISDFLRSNMEELAEAVGWCPDDLEIDRFGLNYDFIEEHALTWIDNLETSSGQRLDDPRHHDHNKPYVQDYLARFGARKVEANALVVRPEAGRELCRQAILRYLDEDALERYQASLKPRRAQLQEALRRSLRGAP